MSYLEYFRGKKVSIPGGGGFFGSHIANALKDTGCEVSIPLTKDGIDFRQKEDCVSYFEKAKPDVVINCAANQGGIGYHKGRQADLFTDNILMGIFLMQAAQQTGVKKFVNIVAGCSYPGYLEADELDESDYWNGKVHDSIFSYGVPRKMSVVYGMALKKQFDFNSIHLIYANMYGPGEHFNPDQSKALAGLLLKILNAKRNNTPSVEVWGTGKPVRDWLYVKDGAEGALRAAAVYDDVEPINIGSGVGISILDLANLIKEIVGFRGEFVCDISRPDGAMKKIFATHNMQEKLGWLPQTDLRAGIKETLEWLEENYDYATSH